MELMIAVAIIGVLVRLALPLFQNESNKARAKSEVGAMFAELGVREEQYRLENGAYLPAAACPASPSTAGQPSAPCIASGMPWNKLRVRIEESKIYCSYTVTTGSGTGTSNPSGFTFTSPSGSWFYVIAICDMDNKPTLNSSYFMSSVDATLQKQNEGH